MHPTTIQHQRAPGRARRRVLSVLLGVTALLVPTLTLAGGSPFSDVSPTNQFYGNIVNMANAGITSGCGGGKFCPKDNVTREQMSAFINRAAPRVSKASFAQPLGNTPGGKAINNGTVASVTVNSLGNEYLFLSTSFFTLTYAAAGTFPCENGYRFTVDGTLVGLAYMFDRDLVQPSSTWATKMISGQEVVAVGPGSHTVRLVYKDGGGNCSNFPGTGSLSAMVIPFDGNMNSIP
jgi:hypothetical protein